jgi:hypothetical protein
MPICGAPGWSIASTSSRWSRIVSLRQSSDSVPEASAQEIGETTSVRASELWRRPSTTPAIRHRNRRRAAPRQRARERSRRTAHHRLAASRGASASAARAPLHGLSAASSFGALHGTAHPGPHGSAAFRESPQLNKPWVSRKVPPPNSAIAGMPNATSQRSNGATTWSPLVPAPGHQEGKTRVDHDRARADHGRAEPDLSPARVIDLPHALARQPLYDGRILPAAAWPSIPNHVDRRRIGATNATTDHRAIGHGDLRLAPAQKNEAEHRHAHATERPSSEPMPSRGCPDCHRRWSRDRSCRPPPLPSSQRRSPRFGQS